MDTDLQEYFSTMLSHLDDMAKRTIFMAGVTYGAQKGREQREAAKADPVPLQISDGVLQFTEEEIEKMPKTFRKEFRTDGCTSHIRKRPCGKGSYTYEIRYRRNGYNVTVTCKNLQEAKKKFIEKLKKAQPCDKQKVSKVPVTFSEFATYYFETFRKRKVAEKTYKNDLYRLTKYLFPHFRSIPISKIIPGDCQELLQTIEDRGRSKTAAEIYSLLCIIFKAAILHGIITRNPMDMVPSIQHERQHGSALTHEEEHNFLKAMQGSRYQAAFAVLLYTGLRPNEYQTAKIKGDFIVARNSKRKTKKIVYKKIPISPMLAPYIGNITELPIVSLDTLRRRLTELLPPHKLYDLRTTFYSRCKECGISPAARDEFMGHTSGEIDAAYTDLSDEFLLREGKKLKY